MVCGHHSLLFGHSSLLLLSLTAAVAAAAAAAARRGQFAAFDLQHLTGHREAI